MAGRRRASRRGGTGAPTPRVRTASWSASGARPAEPIVIVPPSSAARVGTLGERDVEARARERRVDVERTDGERGRRRAGDDADAALLGLELDAGRVELAGRERDRQVAAVDDDPPDATGTARGASRLAIRRAEERDERGGSASTTTDASRGIPNSRAEPSGEERRQPD